MKIDLTRKKYRDLVDMLAIANWVPNPYKVDREPRIERNEKPEQKLLPLAKEIDYESLVVYAPEHTRHFPTREYEETSARQAFITEYDNDSVWEELLACLAERDLAGKWVVMTGPQLYLGKICSRSWAH